MSVITARRLAKAIHNLEAATTEQTIKSALDHAIQLAREWLNAIDDPRNRHIRTIEIGRAIVKAYSRARPSRS